MRLGPMQTHDIVIHVENRIVVHADNQIVLGFQLGV